MKILFVTPYFYPKVGGLENYAYNFALQLKKRYKCAIIVVTSNHLSSKNTIGTIQGMRVYRLAPLFKVSNTPIHPLWYFRLRKIIKQENPDAINAHTPVPFIADMAALAAGDTPLYVTYHAYTLYKHTASVFNFFIRFYKLFEYFLLKKARKIIVVTDVIKDSLPKKFRKKIVVIYNAIHKSDLIQIRKPYNSNSAVFIAKLEKTHEWKGLDMILDAMKLVDKKIHLSVIGEGDNKEYYQEKAKRLKVLNKVTFYGKKLEKEKQQILQNASLGIIYPISSNDAFPTVALEYWANKIPVVAANISPLNKVFVNKKTAYFAKAKSPKDLAQAISYVSSHKSLFNRLASNSFTEVKEKYLLEKEAAKLYALLRRVS